MTLKKNITDLPFEKCTMMNLITEGIAGKLLQSNDKQV